MNITKTLLSLAIVSTLSASTFAVAAPNGVPFVTINGQIHEIQGDVQTLKERYKSLMDLVDFENLEDRLLASESEIASLKEDNAELLSRVAQTEGDIASIDLAISGNFELIKLLEEDVEKLQAFISFADNLASGVCPTGQAVISVTAAGALVCGSIATGGSLLESVTVFGGPPIRLAAGDRDSFIVGCPAGYVVSGGGFTAVEPMAVSASHATTTADGDPGWLVDIFNPGAARSWVMPVVTCMR